MRKWYSMGILRGAVKAGRRERRRRGRVEEGFCKIWLLLLRCPIVNLPRCFVLGHKFTREPVKNFFPLFIRKRQEFSFFSF